MDITCNSCGATLKIPDNKLPSNQKVKVACPKCKSKITIDTRTIVKEDAPVKPETEKTDLGCEEDSGPLEIFDKDAQLAIILDNDEKRVEKHELSLKELSYVPIVCSTVQEAMGKLRLHHFNIVILSDGFDGQKISESTITHYLNSLAISIRRNIFLVLVGDKFKTMDNMRTFVESANLVINPVDMPKLTLILKNSLSDHEKFYKVFFDTLKEFDKE